MDKTLRSLFWFLILLTTCGLIFLLRGVLSPFLIAALIAYLGDPVADRLEQKGLSRSSAAITVFLLFILAFFACVLLLIPMVVAQVEILQQVLPGYIEWFQNTVVPWVNQTLIDSQDSSVVKRLQALLNENWQKAGDVLGTLLANVTRSGLAIIGWFGSLIVVPVVAFYLLRDWDILMSHINDLMPRAQAKKIKQMAFECDQVLSAFFRGQLMIMLCLSLIYSLGLWMVGLDLALMIGMLAGVASVVPYLGAAVGIVAASIAVLVQFHDWIYLVMVAAVFGVGQLVESLFLTPVLVGDKIGLHPVAVIFAVLAGGQLFGFNGILLALPVAAVLVVILRHAHHSYTQSVFYRD